MELNSTRDSRIEHCSGWSRLRAGLTVSGLLDVREGKGQTGGLLGDTLLALTLASGYHDNQTACNDSFKEKMSLNAVRRHGFPLCDSFLRR